MFLLCLVVIESVWAIQTVQVAYPDHQRDDRSVGATVSWSDGLNQKTPIVIFSHCSWCWGDQYAYLESSLTKNGFIFVSLLDYQGPDDMFATTEDYALDLAFLLQEIPNDKTIPIHSFIDPHSAAVGGHSTGGSATFIAGNSTNFLPYRYNSAFSAAFSMSGCVEAMEPIRASASNDTIPFLVLGGTLDCLCPDYGEKQTFGNLSSKCKYFIDIERASHCHFLDTNQVMIDVCLAAENVIGDKRFCHDGKKLLEGEEQHDLVVRYLVPFLESTLKSNVGAKNRLKEILKEDNQKGVILGVDRCV